MTARSSARATAIAEAGRAVADGLALRDSLPPQAAAEAAWTPSGPSVDELERRIRAERGGELVEVDFAAGETGAQGASQAAAASGGRPA